MRAFRAQGDSGRIPGLVIRLPGFPSSQLPLPRISCTRPPASPAADPPIETAARQPPGRKEPEVAAGDVRGPPWPPCSVRPVWRGVDAMTKIAAADGGLLDAAEP